MIMPLFPPRLSMLLITPAAPPAAVPAPNAPINAFVWHSLSQISNPHHFVLIVVDPGQLGVSSSDSLISPSSLSSPNDVRLSCARAFLCRRELRRFATIRGLAPSLDAASVRFRAGM